MEKRTDRAFIYILTNKRYGTLYIGLTTNLMKRMHEHKNKLVKGFTEKYHLSQLVYYEIYDDIQAAANREQLMKKWNRQWKIQMIEKQNPHWLDLFEDLKKKYL